MKTSAAAARTELSSDEFLERLRVEDGSSALTIAGLPARPRPARRLSSGPGAAPSRRHGRTIWSPTSRRSAAPG